MARESRGWYRTGLFLAVKYISFQFIYLLGVVIHLCEASISQVNQKQDTIVRLHTSQEHCKGSLLSLMYHYCHHSLLYHSLPALERHKYWSARQHLYYLSSGHKKSQRCFSYRFFWPREDFYIDSEGVPKWYFHEVTQFPVTQGIFASWQVYC